MSTQERRIVAVEPQTHRWRSQVVEAVVAGGAEVAKPGAASAIVWLAGPGGPDPQALLHPGVVWVQLQTAGIDGWLRLGTIDSQRCWTSAAGAYGPQVAEHAVALLLAGAKRIHDHARAQTWSDAKQSGRTLFGSTVAVVGAGGIGAEVIRLLAPFGTETIAVTRSGRDVPFATRCISAADLDDVWPIADFIVLAAPATAQTEHLISTDQLQKMKSHAWLVNVARGSLVDTDALVSALRDGVIGGAALDVTDPEPLPDGHPLWVEGRALITPHVANPSDAQLAAFCRLVTENVRRYSESRPLESVIDTGHGY